MCAAAVCAGAWPARAPCAEEPPPSAPADDPTAPAPEPAAPEPAAPAPPPPVAPPPREAPPPQAAEAEPARPEVAATEEEIAQRALERALVERGALLLPPWQPEAAVQLAYGHEGLDTAVALEGGGVGLGRVRSHTGGAALNLRLGLPGKLQVDGSLPFVAARQRTNVGTSAIRADTRPGIGDARLSLSRHLLSAHGGTLQLLAAGSWRAPTGKSPFKVAPDEIPRGQGVHALGASATLVRTSDPLVLLATASYTTHLARDAAGGRVDLADSIGLSLSSLLAITPTESLSLAIDLDRSGDDRVAGRKVIGTDRTAATLQLGVSTVLSRRVLLSIAAAVGITEDAPDFQLGVSVPVRF